MDLAGFRIVERPPSQKKRKGPNWRAPPLLADACLREILPDGRLATFLFPTCFTVHRRPGIWL